MGHIEQRTTGRGRVYIYTDDDGVETKVPSVTTILGALPKGGLEWWGAKLGLGYAASVGVTPGTDLEELYTVYKTTEFSPHKALKAAGNRGTDVHNVAEQLLKHGRLDDLPTGTKASEGYIDALVKWYDTFDVASWEVIAVEARLFSTEHLYAGTTDFICLRPDGVYVVGDFKTSKGVYESHLLQTAAYGHAAKEVGLIPYHATVDQQVVRLGEDGECEVVRSVHTIDDFLTVLRVFHLLKDKTKKGVKLDAS